MLIQSSENMGSLTESLLASVTVVVVAKRRRLLHYIGACLRGKAFSVRVFLLDLPNLSF